ncbi:MAG: hypothetical protein ACJAQT_004820 [Akkermansiaceae bacterium]|jgi:hypothetical protein
MVTFTGATIANMNERDKFNDGALFSSERMIDMEMASEE